MVACSVQLLLDIRNITAYRGAWKVFDGFSLQVEAGCCTAILGPNGAGKSTLIKLIAGEIHPVFSQESSIRIYGRDCWNVWELRSQLGIVSHDLQHEYLACAEGRNVILSGFYSSIDTWRNQAFTADHCRKASEVMDQLGIVHLKARAFGSMSTGEQRRFLLGRALVNDPETLLFDEPTSGLDLSSTFQYLELLGSLMRQGKTILLVTHHVHEIPLEIRRVVMLRNGSIFGDGKPEELLTSGKLSQLYDYPVEAVALHGTVQIFPARAFL